MSQHIPAQTRWKLWAVQSPRIYLRHGIHDRNNTFSRHAPIANTFSYAGAPCHNTININYGLTHTNNHHRHNHVTTTTSKHNTKYICVMISTPTELIPFQNTHWLLIPSCTQNTLRSLVSSRICAPPAKAHWNSILTQKNPTFLHTVLMSQQTVIYITTVLPLARPCMPSNTTSKIST